MTVQDEIVTTKSEMTSYTTHLSWYGATTEFTLSNVKILRKSDTFSHPIKPDASAGVVRLCILEMFFLLLLLYRGAKLK